MVSVMNSMGVKNLDSFGPIEPKKCPDRGIFYLRFANFILVFAL